jgi:uncharacterized protein DUF4296
MLMASAFAGCAEPVERDPVLDDSTLVTVLADLHLADARARLPDSEPGLRDSVLAFHGVDSVALRTTLEGLIENPDDLVALYSRVLDRLNAVRAP